MPWCPNCKTEYRPGIETCSDCGAKLVEELEKTDDSMDEMIFPADDGSELLNDERAQYQKLVNSAANSYVKKEDKYKDLNSTFQVFLVFGILMIIFDILNMAGVFHLFNSWLQHVVILATSIAFIYVAIHSKLQAKQVHSEIGLETSITEEISNWLTEHMTKETLDQMYQHDLSKEENFLIIIDATKEQLIAAFPNADQSLMDTVIEEYYDQYFEA